MANRLTFKITRERYHDDVLRVSFDGEVVGFSQINSKGNVLFRFKTLFSYVDLQKLNCPWFWEYYPKEFNTLAEIKEDITKNRKSWIKHFSKVIETTNDWSRKKEEANGKSE